MTPLSLRSARTSFETSEAVAKSVADNGELVLTVGQMAKQNLPEKPIYQALAKAVGNDTALFRFRPRTQEESAFPISTTWSVFAESEEKGSKVHVYGLDLSPIPGVEFVEYKLGPGGFAKVMIGSADLEVEIPTSSGLMGELRSLDEGEEIVFPVQGGQPTVLVEIGQDAIPALRAVPQRDVPPHSTDIPHKVDLEVTAILPVTRQYGEPRLEVVRKDTGEKIIGLIATGPIRQAIGKRENMFAMDEAVIGESFQILEVATKKDRDGKPVPVFDRNKKPAVDEEGNPRFQQSVIVRRTTGGGVELDLSL